MPDKETCEHITKYKPMAINMEFPPCDSNLEGGEQNSSIMEGGTQTSVHGCGGHAGKYYEGQFEEHRGNLKSMRMSMERGSVGGMEERLDGYKGVQVG